MLWGIVEWFSGAWCWLTDFERGTLAGWISGVGSLAAAGTALWLAYDARKIKVAGSCDVEFIVTDSSMKQVLAVSATNVGYRAVTITGISFRIKQGKFAKQRKDEQAMRLLPGHRIPGSSETQVTLADGERARWFYSLMMIVGGFITKKMIESERDAKALVCVLHTTHGKKISIKPTNGLVGMIFAALDNIDVLNENA